MKRVASFCSGITADAVAWGPLGWTHVSFSEVEPFPCAVLAHHYPHVPNVGDMTRATLPRGCADVVVAGTPCQSFSVAGLRGGLADPRGNLALDLLRHVDGVRPRWVVWENVPGVLSADGGRAFGAFLGGLAELGYGWAYRVLDAQHFGLAQRRQRVFVVGCAGGWAPAAAVLFERASLRGDSAPRRDAGPRAAPGAARGAYAGGQERSVAGALLAHGRRGDLDSETFIAHDTVGALTTGASAGGGWRVGADEAAAGQLVPMAFDEAQVTSAINRSRVQPGLPAPTLGRESRLHVALATPVDLQNGLLGEDVAGTLMAAQSKGNRAQAVLGFHHTQDPISGDVSPCLSKSADGMGVAHAVGEGAAVRRLTPRECERLQGFPDDYTRIPWRTWQEAQRKGTSYESLLAERGLRLREPAGEECPDGPRYRALGNSKAVPVVRWIGRRIDAVDAALEASAFPEVNSAHIGGT